MGHTGFVYETALEEARAKDRDAWLAYGYDPDTPRSGVEGDGEEDIPKVEDNTWWDSTYGRGNDEEDGRDQGEGGR